MKLHTNNNTIEKIGNVSNETGFRMKASRKAFQILSDLYSDKPLAIVRELGCNAHDSHVAAGKADVPFHIHAPNALEPWITIRDFGTGISPDNIYSIYAVYFESTKTNTNDQIGCLGLGSKSPFCYTDNFTIVSIFEGEKRTYNAFFNEDSMPAITLLATDKTGEENGISIQIPVKPEDFHNFTNAIKKSFRFFNVKPTISGGVVDWHDEAPILEGKDWAVYKSFGYNEAFAVMGGVPYPLDVYKVNDDNRGVLQRSGVVMKFETGELDIVPSREGLSYNPQTIKALNEKVASVIEDISKKVIATLEEQTNIVDAIRMFATLENKFPMLGSKLNNFKWNNIDVSYPNRLIWDYIKEEKLEGNHHLTCYEKRNWGRGSINTHTNISFNDNVEWYVNDMTRGAVSRVKEYVKSNSNIKVILISSDVHKVLLDKGFPIDFFQLTSTLPSVAKIKCINNGSGSSKQDVVYNIGYYYKETWDRELLDVSKPPKFYIVKDKKNWSFCLNINGLRPIQTKSDLNSLLTFLGYKDNDIVMVSEKGKKALDGISEDFVSYCNNNLNLDYDVDAKATITHYFSNNYYSHRVVEMTKSDAFNDLDNECVFKKFILELINTKKQFEKDNKIDTIMHLLASNANGKAGVIKKPEGDDMAKYLIENLFGGSLQTYGALEILKIYNDKQV